MNIFLWENFGPMHVDRCEAVAKSGTKVIGLELYSHSDTYEWIPEQGMSFKKVTLFQKDRPKKLQLLWRLLVFRIRQGKSNWFLCHYERWEVLFFAFFLRVMGDNVFTMGDSKFDDYPRYIWKEIIKRIFLLPYQGAIACGYRSKDYLRFLGLPKNKIVGEYDTLSLNRIRNQANLNSIKSNISYGDRHFTIIARHVPKKNLPMALHAYALYCAKNSQPIKLHLCGSGLLEEELRSLASELNITENVIFHGFIQTDQISKVLASTLALILPSIEEQFGLVVIEAQAMGLPVLLSDVCGARDHLVRTGVNGFVFEPDNPEGLAWFMSLLATDEALWARMSRAALNFAPRGDVSHFVEAVNELIGITKS